MWVLFQTSTPLYFRYVGVVSDVQIKHDVHLGKGQTQSQCWFRLVVGRDVKWASVLIHPMQSWVHGSYVARILVTLAYLSLCLCIGNNMSICLDHYQLTLWLRMSDFSTRHEPSKDLPAPSQASEAQQNGHLTTEELQRQPPKHCVS